MTFSVVFQCIFRRFSVVTSIITRISVLLLVVTSIITRTEISFFMYNTRSWFRIDRNHRNIILFVVVFIHFELRFYVLERYFRTHFEILDHFVSKCDLTYSVNYYDIFSDLTLPVYITEYYWILKFTEFTEYLVVSTEYLNLADIDIQKSHLKISVDWYLLILSN